MVRAVLRRIEHVSQRPDAARKAAQEFVRFEVFPADRVAVLAYGGALRVDQDFTGDADLLARALYTEGNRGLTSQSRIARQQDYSSDRLAPNAAAANAAPDVDRQNQSDLIHFQDVPDVNRIQSFQSNERLYKALSLVGKTLARVRGRKTIVLFSNGFAPEFADHGLFKNYRDMVNIMNASNVAIYPVDAGGESGRVLGDASSRGPEAVTVSRPLRTPTDNQRLSAADEVSALKILAADTGGKALVFSNNLVEQLQEMAYSTSSYYMLGYSPDPSKETGKFREIKVKVKKSGARVLARKGYFQKEDFSRLTKSERKNQIRDALLSWADISDLPIQLGTSFYPLSTDRTLLGLELALPRGLLAVTRRGPAPRSWSTWWIRRARPSPTIRRWSAERAGVPAGALLRQGCRARARGLRREDRAEGQRHRRPGHRRHPRHGSRVRRGSPHRLQPGPDGPARSRQPLRRRRRRTDAASSYNVAGRQHYPPRAMCSAPRARSSATSGCSTSS